MSSELRKRLMQAGASVPYEWDVVPLEALLKDGKSISVGVMYPGPHTPGGTPLIKVGDIKGGLVTQKPEYCISSETDELHQRTRLHGDELLITLVGNPGECVVVEPCMAGWNPARAIAVIRLANPGWRIYLKAVLESAASKHLIDSVLNTTVQKTLNLKDIRQLPIPLPPEKVIQSLSDFSDVLSKRISLLRETNATLEAIAQALFKSWFVDFEPVHARARGEQPAGLAPEVAALFPDSFEEFELGMVPQGWAVGTLSEICSISSGKRPPERSDELSDECHIPLYGGAGLMGYTSASLFETPRIVTGRVGTLGKVHVAYPPFWASDNVLVLTPAEDSIFAFCLHWVSAIDVHALNRGSSQPLLTQKDLGAQLGVIPLPEVLVQFEATVSPLYKQIRANLEQTQTLANLRDTLLPRLISGQLRLPDAEQQLKDLAV